MELEIGQVYRSISGAKYRLDCITGDQVKVTRIDRGHSEKYTWNVKSLAIPSMTLVIA